MVDMARWPAVFLLCCTLGRAEDPKRIPVEIRSRQEWFAIPHARLPAGNYAAVSIDRAYDPTTGGIFDESRDARGDPRGLVRCFRLEKRTFLLGEPIVIEHRIEMTGTGRWQEHSGGNYRRFGRNDNYRFVLRHADGAFVPDPYEPWKHRTGEGGGISGDSAITRETPYSHWLAIQRYSALVRPGTYRLYCIRFAGWSPTVGWRRALEAAIPRELRASHRLGKKGNRLLRIADGEPSGYTLEPRHRTDHTASPVTTEIPEEHADALRAAGVAVEQIGDFAHFTIEVRTPTARERAAMVERAAGEAARGDGRGSPTERRHAIAEAIWFARQDDFLPLIQRWLAEPAKTMPQDFDGLAMRESLAALKLLLQKSAPDLLQALRYLPREHIPAAVSPLIERLTDVDDRARSVAFSQLAAWTGQRFDARWPGYHHGRPTLEEGRALQAKWRAWWEEHRKTFEPAQR